jgi:hypothetical protein
VLNSKDSPVRTTGTFSFGQGVDSRKTPTEFSLENNPDGLTRQELAWAVNCTMRDDAISPRDPWIKKGWINQNLLPQIIPGTPQRTIPQPNIPPIQTPATQTLEIVGTWHIPAVGQSTVMTVATHYTGNVGDITQLFLTEGGSPSQGIFSITAFTSSTITLLGLTSPFGGGTFFNEPVIFTLQSLGPGTPQPPIIIPAGPPTVIPCQPYYQGGILYTPPNGTPYGIMVIGGHLIKVDPDFSDAVTDLSEMFNLYFPVTARCYFCQAETFLIIQAGDYDSETGTGTLPLFWDGTTLYQSNGLTGVTVVGTPIANVYDITTTAPWTPATSGNLSTMVLASQYTGKLYDNILLATVAASPVTIGNFRVLGISGNKLTLESIYVVTSSQQPPGPFTATLTVPTLNNGSPDPTQTISIGDGSWTVPTTTGSQALLNLTSLYYGSAGDTIVLYNASGTVSYGTFQVVSFNASFQLVLNYVAQSSSNYSGKAVFGTMLATVTAVRSFSQTFTAQAQEGNGGPFVVTAAGGGTTVYLPPFNGSFLSKLYDNVEITIASSGVNLGYYRIVGQGQFLDSAGHSLPFATFESIEPNTLYQGQTFNGPLTMKVVPPPQTAGYLTINAGTWSVPPVGQSVSLQMLWPDILGPSYPGNIGDIVQLQSGASTIAYFMVTSFDNNGNITLTTFSNSMYVTPTANIGAEFTGEQTLTMTIVQVPSIIGENINQIPAATAMVYYQGIVWYAQGAVISGGDIRGGPSGTNAPSYTNSVLNVTENPLALGGDGFALPIPGNITGMGWPQQQNAALGQGVLYVGTVNGVCSLQVPLTRTSWIGMNANNLPQINVILGGKREAPGYGFVNDWSIIPINGDLYFQTIKPGITSIILAQRYFQQPGNIDISNNEQRLWDFEDTGLLNWISGFFFNNRLLMTALPQQTNNGVIHNAIIPMDTTPIDTFEELTPPNWEGMHEGLQVFQLLTSGEFNGQQRAFAVTLNPNNAGEIDFYENIVSNTVYFDNDGTKNVPIQWQFETPALTWGREGDLKELLGLELFVDQIVGEVIFLVEWRPDFASCYSFWTTWKECFAENSLSVPSIKNPSPYPIDLPPGYKVDGLPRPPMKMQPETGRPSADGFQHQFRITITGQTRIRGLLIHAQFKDRNIYQYLIRSMQKVINAIFK